MSHDVFSNMASGTVLSTHMDRNSFLVTAGRTNFCFVDGLDITKDLINLLQRLALGFGIGKRKHQRAEGVCQDEENLCQSVSTRPLVLTHAGHHVRG